MAIFNSDGASYQKVKKTFNRNSRVQKVWVHDGTKFLLVSGRMLEVLWEKDMSTYGGMSWGGSYNREPYNNIIVDMHILDNGDLIGVIPYVINNNDTNQYSTGRKSLIKLTADSGEISYFSSYTNWQSWRSVANYTYTAHPLGLVKCDNYYAAWSEHGIFYLFNSSGSYVTKYENSTWHTDGSSKTIHNEIFYLDCINVAYEETGKCIYYKYTDQNDNDTDSSSYMASIYRIGLKGSSFYTPHRHYAGVRYYRTYDFNNGILIDNETRKGIAYFDGKNGYDSTLVVFDASYSYSSSKTDVSPLCSVTLGSKEEYPVAVKDGYVYTHNTRTTVTKRSLTDLSVVWTTEVPYVQSSRDCGYSLHKPLSPCDGGFMLPNGCVVYPDGYVSISNKIIGDNLTSSYVVRASAFNDDLSIGYMMCYDDNDTAQVCKVIKFKEVSK